MLNKEEWGMSFLQVVTEEEICCKIYLNVHIYLLQNTDIHKKEICWYEGELIYDKSGGK